MIVELFVRTIQAGRESDYTNLDTYGNENVSLTFQVDEVRSLENKNASYSKNFNLPATTRNNRFFEHYYDLDRYTLEFNANKKVQCYLQVDGIIVIEGFLKLEGTLEKQTEISYSVVIFNQVVNLIDALGDDDLGMLNWDDLSHNFTYDNVISSWAQADSSGNPVDWVYQIVNTGNMEDDGTGTVLLDPRVNYVFCLRLKYVLNRIFQYAGFVPVYKGYLAQTEFRNLYFDTRVRRDFGQEIDDQQIRANITPNGPTLIGCDIYHQGYLIGTTPNTSWAMPTTNVTGDINNQFDEATCTFTAQADCTINVLIYVQAHNVSNQTVNVTCLANGVPIGTQPVFSGDPQDTPCQPSSVSLFFSASFPMLQGDVMQFTFMADYTAQPVPNFGGYMDFGLGTSGNGVDIQVQDATIASLIQTQFEGLKMADIVKDVLTMFNVISTDVGNNTIELIPYRNYVQDNVVDWTKKVDINEIKIENLPIPRQVIFRHAQDENDFYHNTYIEENAITYGESRVMFDTDNEDIVTIELKIFAAPLIKTITGTDIHIQHCAQLNNDGQLEAYKNKPRIVHLKGTQLSADVTNTTYQLTPDNATYNLFPWTPPGTSHNFYPELTHFNQKIASTTTTGNQFVFGIINPSAIVNFGQMPTNTLFKKFWRQYINEKFNIDARLIKVKIRLSPTDIMALDFSIKYRIQDQFYRLNKVDYNTYKNKLSSVELIRV